MGFGDFWLQSNNGKKINMKEVGHGVRKEQVDSKFHNLFDIYDENGDGTLENNELDGIFKSIKKFAGADKILNSSENIQAKSIFAQQANIEDADFQGFVQSISTANARILVWLLDVDQYDICVRKCQRRFKLLAALIA